MTSHTRNLIVCSLVALVMFASGLLVGATKAYSFGATMTSEPYVHDRIAECAYTAKIYELADPRKQSELSRWLSAGLLQCSRLISNWPDRIRQEDHTKVQNIMAAFHSTKPADANN